MTSHPATHGSQPPPGCPAHDARMSLYGPEFADNPTKVYTELRRHGSTAPVDLAPGVPATLVIGYETALEVLRAPDTFPKDPRRWQVKVPPDCPVLPMMMYRPNCLFADGATHARLRAAVTDSLERIDSSTLRTYVETSAEALIAEFRATGEADLLTQYARILPLLVLNQLFGTPPEIGDRMLAGMSGIFDGVDAERANAELGQALMELVALKRQRPGADVTSWLMAHPTKLTDDEMVHQLVVLMGAGCEPQQNLIANAMRLLLTEDRFAGDLSGGSMPVEDALDEVLWADPPMANYAVTYPVQDVNIEGALLAEAEPVVISFAAANNDPVLAAEQRMGNRAHLAWSAGPHTCPAQGPARLIASVAIEKLLDELPDMDLAVPVEDLGWRPGPFHRALTALPVRFPAVSASVQSDTDGESPWNNAPVPSPSTPPDAISTPKPSSSASAAPRRWWSFLGRWWRGQ